MTIALACRPIRVPDSICHGTATPVRFDGALISVKDIVDIARRRRGVVLGADDAFRKRIQDGADFVAKLLAEDGVIYGVTTGYGDSCTVAIPPHLVAELQQRLYAYHGIGAGRHLDAFETRAVLATRLASLCRGMSGVGVALLEQIVALLRHDILPFPLPKALSAPAAT